MHKHYHLEVQANPKEIAQKNRCYFLHLWEKQDYAMTFFLYSHLGLSRSLRSNDIWPLNFEAATSKFGNHSWTFGSSPQRGKVELCMTNDSKVLIYLTLLYFLLHYLQEYSKIWNIAKSNKSELKISTILFLEMAILKNPDFLSRPYMYKEVYA